MIKKVSIKKPFIKADYLKSTILISNGQEVRPTEEDVDKCVEYLQIVGVLIEQQSKIKSQQTEIADLKKKEIGTYEE